MFLKLALDVYITYHMEMVDNLVSGNLVNCDQNKQYALKSYIYHLVYIPVVIILLYELHALQLLQHMAVDRGRRQYIFTRPSTPTFPTYIITEHGLHELLTQGLLLPYSNDTPVLTSIHLLESSNTNTFPEINVPNYRSCGEKSHSGQLGK